MKLNDIRKQRRLEKNTLNSLLSLFVVRLHNNETSTETVIDRKKQFYDSDYQAFSQWEITTKIQQLPNYIVFIIIPFFADKDVFLILYIIFNNFNKTLSTAINYFNQWQTMDDDMKAIDDFWNTKNFHSMPRQYNIPDSLIAQGNIKNIVSFSNIVINVGDRIRISGETGSGKTTLIKGLIGHEIGVKYNSGCNPLSYIDNIAYMRQDAREHTPIENTTIRQLFYDEDDDNLIFECLRDTTLMHWFKNTIKDLNIAIASRISGGEKTKLCLAIALYQLKKHNKKWLILDEPEQGLDPELAPQVLQKIFNNYTDVTIFIITHLCECRINELGITTIWNVKNGFIYF
jgi:zinc transport system ATP-binding protein